MHVQFQQALPKCYINFHGLFCKKISERYEKSDLRTKIKGYSLHSFKYIFQFSVDFLQYAGTIIR